jgi:Asp-tRNA(Asn)/Glu-tRNA(Gln) amidotransferase A subunit family amidase
MLPGYVQRFMDVADGRRDDLLDSTTQLIDYALALTIADLVAANRALAQSVARFMSLLTTVEYLVTPTLATTAFDAELLFPANEPRNAWGYAFGFASFVPFANFCALPACSICCGFDAQTLPIGLQIVGRRYDDFGVLKIASAYEERRAFDVSWPCVTEPACEAREGVSCSPN